MKSTKKNSRFILFVSFSIAFTVAITVFIYIIGEEDKASAIPIPKAEGRAIGGSIAFDGTYFWALRIPLTYASDGKKEIVKFDKTGQEIFCVVPVENFSDFAFDGKNIWTADVFGSEYSVEFDSKYYILNKETGEFYHQFSIHENYTIDAITAGEGRLWVYLKIVKSNLERIRYFYEIDAGSGGIFNKIRIAEDVPLTCTGMTYLDGFVWMAVRMINHKVLKINSETGNIVDEYDYTGRVINGITNIDGKIYLVDGEKNELFLHKK